MGDRNYFALSVAIVAAESVAIVAAESTDIAAESTDIVAVESTAASSVLGLLWQAANVIIVPTNSKADRKSVV